MQLMTKFSMASEGKQQCTQLKGYGYEAQDIWSYQNVTGSGNQD